MSQPCLHPVCNASPGAVRIRYAFNPAFAFLIFDSTYSCTCLVLLRVINTACFSSPRIQSKIPFVAGRSCFRGQCFNTNRLQGIYNYKMHRDMKPNTSHPPAAQSEWGCLKIIISAVSPESFRSQR